MALLTWLHLSDIHLPPGSSDSYRIDKVLTALIKTLAGEASRGRVPDLIFFTGDISDKGKDYAKAGDFFNDLLTATGLTATLGEAARRRLFVVPGNHDVDREKTEFLIRPLATRKAADAFFSSRSAVARQSYFARFHAYEEFFNSYFANIRKFDVQNHYYAELLELTQIPLRLGVVGLNSAWFAQDDEDEKRLWIGERVCDEAFKSLANKGDAEVIFALHHHPYSWLHPEESRHVKGLLTEKADICLYGHMHVLETEETKDQSGKVLRLQSGAVYDNSEFPYRILWGAIDTDTSKVRVTPMTFHEGPPSFWTLDPSLYPDRAPDYTGEFTLPRQLQNANEQVSGPKKADAPVSPAPGQVVAEHKKAVKHSAPKAQGHFEDWLFGFDPVLGDQAVAYFRGQSGVAIRKLLQQHLGQDFNPLHFQASHRVARICETRWQDASPLLVKLIKEGSWFAKVDASKCFRFIPASVASDELAKLAALLDVGNFDVERCAIDALGYWGADNWAFRFSQIALGHEYHREKLAQNCVDALARMIVKETSDSNVYYDLTSFESFLEKWREEEDTLRHFSRTSIENIFVYLTPVAADALSRKWLVHQDTLIRQLAADALGFIRLTRSSKPLANILFREDENYEVRCCAALALGETGGPTANQAILKALDSFSLSDSTISYHGKSLRQSILASLSKRLYDIKFTPFLQRFIGEMVDGHLDIQMQTLYALGLLKVETEHLLTALHSESAAVRGAAALGLAHSQGSAVLKQLRFLEGDAGNPFERLLLEAALVIAGNKNDTTDLHRALCDLTFEYRAVRYITYQWKREILYALSLGGADGLAQAQAWAELMGVNLRRCLDEMELILSNIPSE